MEHWEFRAAPAPGSAHGIVQAPLSSHKGQRQAGVDIPGMLELTFLSLTAELAASKINIGLQILKIWFYRYN